MTQAIHSTAVQKPDLISIAYRSGIWRVAINDEFYGDYTRRYWAIDAAFEKADDTAAGGGSAVITIAMDGEQNALLYDTRTQVLPRAKQASGAERLPWLQWLADALGRWGNRQREA